MLKKTITVILVLLLSACATPSRQREAEVDQARAAEQRPVTLVLNVRPLATLFYWLEQMSQWAPGTSAAWNRTYNERVGLEDEEKALLRKFAFARLELDKKQKAGQPAPDFQQPFGPEGLFTPRQTLADAYWTALLGLDHPGGIPGALGEFFAAEDLHAVQQTVSALAAKVLPLAAPEKAALAELEKRLAAPGPAEALAQLARWLGLEGERWRLQVVPLRVADGVEPFAEAFGDTIFLGLEADQPPADEHLYLIAHEAARRLLARLSAARKAALTQAFVETAGHQPGPFELEEGLLDAFAFGWLPAQLKQPAPEFLGQPRRQAIARALGGLLTEALADGRPFDGRLVEEAARLVLKAAPPRPADFTHGAMVFGSESAIEAFRTGVVRWTVWKFPLEKKYDYAKKFEQEPGRSVLCILSPRDLKQLFALTENMAPLKEALGQAAVYLQRNQGVIVAVPRATRGWVFVVAAPNPEKMKTISRAFFALKQIPTAPVTSE